MRKGRGQAPPLPRNIVRNRCQMRLRVGAGLAPALSSSLIPALIPPLPRARSVRWGRVTAVLRQEPEPFRRSGF